MGPTRSYAPPAYDDGLISDADDDGVLLDCYLAHNVGYADSSGIVVSSTRNDAEAVTVDLSGTASDPLINPKQFACSVDWHLKLEINDDGDWDLTGDFNSFPSFELFVNDQQLIGYSAGSPPFSMIQVLKLCNHFQNETVSLRGTLP